MNSKMRLWINILAIALCFILLIFGIGSIITKTIPAVKEPTIRTDIKDLTLDLEIKLNGANLFTFSSVEGKVEKDFFDIPLNETTFTTEKDVIIMSLKFENKSSKKLLVLITGIHFDEKARFSTIAQDHSNMGIEIARNENKGTLSIILEPMSGLEASYAEGSLKEVNLIYTHILKNLNIHGTPADMQNLIITISTAN